MNNCRIILKDQPSTKSSTSNSFSFVLTNLKFLVLDENEVSCQIETGLIANFNNKLLSDANLLNIVKTDAFPTGLGKSNSFRSGEAGIHVEP